MKQRIDASMIKLKMVTFQFRNEDSTSRPASLTGHGTT